MTADVPPPADITHSIADVPPPADVSPSTADVPPQADVTPSTADVPPQADVTPSTADVPPQADVTPSTADVPPPADVTPSNADVPTSTDVSPWTADVPPAGRYASVSAAFEHLCVPSRKRRKQVKQFRHVLPKALSGEEALKMMREREKRKEEEAAAKLKRKEEWELKKKKKEEEKERKRIEREEKKNKPKSTKAKQIRKRKVPISKPLSDSSSDTSEVPYMDNDSDDFEKSFVDVCPVCHSCKRIDADPTAWISCESCCKWWHIVCAGYEATEIDENFVFVGNCCEC